MFIVVHLGSSGRSVLADLLDRSSTLPAKFAEDGEIPERGRIYLAPPDRHLLIIGERLRLGNGPHENRTRPAIDPLFRSAALCCGPRSIGIVLTGYLNDGASGLHAIKRCGGIAVVQDPADAAVPDMPQNALRLVAADHVVPLAAIPELVCRLVREHAGPPVEPAPEDIRIEVAIAAGGETSIDRAEQLGARSVYSCPECNGALWQIQDGEIERYRCHVGHAHTLESLAEGLQGELGRALTTALRVLQERQAVLRRLAEQARTRKHRSVARTWDERAKAVDAEIEALRKALLATAPTPSVAESAGG